MNRDVLSGFLAGWAAGIGAVLLIGLIVSIIESFSSAPWFSSLVENVFVILIVGTLGGIFLSLPSVFVIFLICWALSLGRAKVSWLGALALGVLATAVIFPFWIAILAGGPHTLLENGFSQQDIQIFGVLILWGIFSGAFSLGQSAGGRPSDSQKRRIWGARHCRNLGQNRVNRVQIVANPHLGPGICAGS